MCQFLLCAFIISPPKMQYRHPTRPYNSYKPYLVREDGLIFSSLEHIG